MMFWLKHRRKFFREVNGKYDARYFRAPLPPDTALACLLEALNVLMRACADICVKPFLAHGTLVGWWWSRAPLPWDDDIDLMVTHSDLITLLSLDGQVFDGRYRLEINPNHVVRLTRNRWPTDTLEANKIDARFFDTHNGLYIDITALHPVDEARMATKCPHVFPRDWLFPLRDSTLSGIEVFVPHLAAEVLVQEYGSQVLASTSFNGHRFDSSRSTWVRDLEV